VEGKETEQKEHQAKERQYMHGASWRKMKEAMPGN
jgi:hypothetical protein